MIEPGTVERVLLNELMGNPDHAFKGAHITTVPKCGETSRPTALPKSFASGPAPPAPHAGNGTQPQGLTTPAPATSAVPH